MWLLNIMPFTLKTNIVHLEKEQWKERSIHINTAHPKGILSEGDDDERMIESEPLGPHRIWDRTIGNNWSQLPCVFVVEFKLFALHG